MIWRVCIIRPGGRQSNLDEMLSPIPYSISLSICVAALFMAGVLASGCASVGGNNGNNGGGDGTPTVAPSIVTQPANQSVPMGVSATFTSGVSGYPLTYQWMKNGVAIPGATSGSVYTIPAVAFADNGSTYTLTISNSLGSATTSPATLTVTARAPQQSDLRFQQVDSPSTVNGYTGELRTNASSSLSWGFGNATGTPLSIGPGCDGPLFGCVWELNASYLPAGMSGLSTYYQGTWLDDNNLETQLNALSAKNAVVTGLDMEQVSNTFGASWVQTSGPTDAGDSDPWTGPNEIFDMAQHTVAPDFQAAASQGWREQPGN
jgi:hypothetical protein